VASQGIEAALFGLFGPDTTAKFTLGALLTPLFRQFQKMNSANFAATEVSEVPRRLYSRTMVTGQ
jgi:hypothetical protein